LGLPESSSREDVRRAIETLAVVEICRDFTIARWCQLTASALSQFQPEFLDLKMILALILIGRKAMEYPFSPGDMVPFFDYFDGNPVQPPLFAPGNGVPPRFESPVRISICLLFLNFLQNIFRITFSPIQIVIWSMQLTLIERDKIESPMFLRLSGYPDSLAITTDTHLSSPVAFAAIRFAYEIATDCGILNPVVARRVRVFRHRRRRFADSEPACLPAEHHPPCFSRGSVSRGNRQPIHLPGSPAVAVRLD
jgi:hypothetical protein